MARIAYRYEIDGRSFTSNRLGAKGMMQADSTLVGKYFVGKTVDVFYDPANPASAVLERKRLSADLFLLPMGALLLLFGVAVLVALIRN